MPPFSVKLKVEGKTIIRRETEAGKLTSLTVAVDHGVTGKRFCSIMRSNYQCFSMSEAPEKQPHSKVSRHVCLRRNSVERCPRGTIREDHL